MSNPLSPRSEASLNVSRAIFSTSGNSKHTTTGMNVASLQQTASMAEASENTTQKRSYGESGISEAARDTYASSSPSKKYTSGMDFSIHEDDSTKLAEIRPASSSPKKSEHSANTLVRSKHGQSSESVLSPQRQLLWESELRSSSNSSHGKDQHRNDDTCDARSTVSEDTCFTAFSAVPNVDMTLFAALGNRTADNTLRSPSRSTSNGRSAPENFFATPSTSKRPKISDRSPSPTPRAQLKSSRDGDTTSLLLDFTEQFDAVTKPLNTSPSRRGVSPSKTQNGPELLSYINGRRNPSPSKSKAATPSSRRTLLNLLDFDLPPQPTPRSVPSITVRELESLKSTYLSEISSLKASLNGREAEIESLKKAVGDAERRVGEALENFRDERNAREHAEREKAEWEKKGREVESVLKSVREEFLSADREREDLVAQLDESNRRREEAELKAAERSSQLAESTISGASGANMTEAEVTKRVAQQLDEKMENLARELHAVYKKKHETKVATLKKTYEARSDKKIRELESKIEDLNKQNEELQAAKDATLSGTLPADYTAGGLDDSRASESQKAELEEQKARVAGLSEEIKAVKSSHEQLLKELEAERVEKGELVAAVDEMLALQSEVGAPTAIEDFRRSISGRPPSGLKGPGFGTSDSKIARGGASGLARSVSGGKSKMMSNIERMGMR